MTEDDSPPDLFDDATAIAAIDRRAADDIAALRLISHEAVLHWLKGWGYDRPLWPVS